MKFAQVDGQRREAIPGLSGGCPSCGHPMVSKCGESRVWHWAHRGKRLCDPWWENETEWHRDWKAHFPEHWQEVVHIAESGERHIADVKTVEGWVIEFQHSFLKPEERRSRDCFYPQLVWVVDCTSLKRGVRQLLRTLESGSYISTSPIVKRVSNDAKLLEVWGSCRAPVFFDFGEDLPLWCLLPMGAAEGVRRAVPFERPYFIELLREGVKRTGHSFAECISALQRLGSVPPPMLRSVVQAQYRRSLPSQRPLQMNRFRGRL